MKPLNEFLNDEKQYTKLNEGKMHTIVSELATEFKAEVKTNQYDWALEPFMTNKVWTKMNGRKYKEPGKFRVNIYRNDDKETVDEKRQVQNNFWPWLIKQSGVKSMGEVSGEFEGAGYSEAVEYKGVVFIKRKDTDKYTITEYFSKGRFKNSGMWNQK